MASADNVVAPVASGTQGCVFCEIIQKGERLIYQVLFRFIRFCVYLRQDEKVVAFTDINPQSSVHVQVVPREHIENLKSLTPAHVELGIRRCRMR